MRVPSIAVYAVVIVLGALVINLILNFFDLDPMPWDITINQENLHLHILVFYSLACSVGLLLFFWWWRR